MSATFPTLSPTLSPLDVPTLSGSWKPLDWSHLYAVWWGVPLDANLDMLVVPEPLRELLGFMGYIEADTILIRDEYKTLYDRATQYLTARPTGIVVSGSPGTGKSIGLIYLLRRRMADRLTTMLTVGILTYIVAPQGAFVQPSTSVIDLDIPRYRPPMWSLVATRKGVREQPHWALVSSRASAIQATSPDMSTYKGWRSNRSAPVWCMAPWSREELYRALPLQFIYPNQPDQQAEIRRRLEDAITTYGPHSARTVFDALLSPGRVSASLEIALGSIHRANLTKILSETKASPDSVFHSLFTVVRVGTHDFDDDTVAVQFSSPYIATRVRETLKMLEFQEARHLIQLY
ncbi:hypothetical protein AX16_004637 [Volvariella volvacea WC 439]|nr:hypothetical protein AX16_004637 [Volvariella volvacea WC 439]